MSLSKIYRSDIYLLYDMSLVTLWDIQVSKCVFLSQQKHATVILKKLFPLLH